MKVFGIIVDWYDERNDKERTTHLLTSGNSFADILSEIETSYPGLMSVKITDMFTHDRFIEISKEQFDNFYEKGWLE